MTAVLLSAISQCKNESELDTMINLVKKLKVSAKNVADAVEDSIARGFSIGTKVTLVNDDEVGEVVKYNLSTVGFYTGDRFPIIVKFERGTFEYGPESLSIV